jgi:hypothetical protein
VNASPRVSGPHWRSIPEIADLRGDLDISAAHAALDAEWRAITADVRGGYQPRRAVRLVHSAPVTAARCTPLHARLTLIA